MALLACSAAACPAGSSETIRFSAQGSRRKQARRRTTSARHAQERAPAWHSPQPALPPAAAAPPHGSLRHGGPPASPQAAMEQQRFNGIWFQAAQQQIPCLPAASELPSTATVRLRLWRTFCSRLSLAPSRDTTWRALAAGWRDSAQANVAAQQGWEAHSAHELPPHCQAPPTCPPLWRVCSCSAASCTRGRQPRTICQVPRAWVCWRPACFAVRL